MAAGVHALLQACHESTALDRLDGVVLELVEDDLAMHDEEALDL